MEVVAALCAGAAPLAPKKIFEDIVERVAEAASAESEAIGPSTLLGSGMAEHVVALAFVLIAQCLVGLVDFFEFFF